MTSEKKIRWLKQVCFLSLLLNFVFVFLFYIVAFSKDIYRSDSFSGSLVAKSKSLPTFSEDFLDSLSHLSLTETIQLLDEDKLFYGYPLKLWALSIAIHTYHVDITSVLSHVLTFIELKYKDQIWLLPKISEQEYQAVRQYLSIEKFPFTSLGLFLLLVNGYEQGIIDEGCLYAFCNTPEFLYLRILLSGADATIPIESLVHMVIRGGPEMFFSLCNEQTRMTHISDKYRRECLLAYAKKGEALAAQLLLIHDHEWVIHEFEDQQLKDFISLLPSDCDYVQQFIAKMVASPRRHLLQAEDVLRDGLTPIEGAQEVLPHYIEYRVEKGDSLWLLARRFNVTIQEIKDLNQLSHDGVRLGQKLKIPEKNN